MSLDKWIKTEKKPKKEKKEPKKKETIEERENKETLETNALKIKKYELICSKKSCGYQKKIMKKSLSEKDKTCPRCKSIMKIKKS